MMAMAIFFTSNLSWAGEKPKKPKKPEVATAVLNRPEAEDLAVEAPTSRAELCKKSRARDYFMKLALNRDNRMGFKNSGGMFGSGVCWWHSRFQRAALYLSVFRPNFKKPSALKAREIIKKIARRSQVVEIPGYSNLRAFAADWEELIQKRLDSWQLTDGFLMQQWVVGLIGQTDTYARMMKKMMDALYLEVHYKKNVTYQKLQLKGVDAHAWLVVAMDKTYLGYRLHVIDSNYPKSLAYTDYRVGDTSLGNVKVVTTTGYIKSFNYGRFVAYSERQDELQRLKNRVKAYCGTR